ncbi:MAG: presenilin family intramembrane aspartyl protease [Candidatus Micrarchaeia archaeon]
MASPRLGLIEKVFIMFVLTQLLGIYIGTTLIENAKIVPEFNELSVSPVKDSGSMLNALFFVAYVLLGAGFMLLLIKYYRGVMIFKIIEFMIIFSASNVVFFVLSFSALGMDPTMGLLASLVVSFAFALAKFAFKQVKNIAAVISSAGVGAIFGFSVSFIPTLAIVLAVSLYDFWAVFKTRHMVTLARELDRRDLSFAVTASEKVRVKTSEKVGGKTVSRMVEQEGGRLDLGTGDLAVPTMLSVSAYPFGGMAASLGAMAGASIALYLMLRVVNERRLILPALPPICLGAVVGILAAKLMGF